MVQIFRVNLGLSPVAKAPISQYISQYLAIPIEFGDMGNCQVWPDQTKRAVRARVCGLGCADAGQVCGWAVGCHFLGVMC